MSPSPKDRLRGVVRRARTNGSAASSDDTSPADRLLASGLFDPWYYGLQTLVDVPAGEAAEHYLREGAEAGLLPNPLTDVDATRLAPAEVVAALLDGTARTFPVRAHLDPGLPADDYLRRAHAGETVPPLGTRSWERFVDQRRQQSQTLGLLLAAGLFDLTYYEVQLGRTFRSDRQAMWHFLEQGEAAGLSPTPLYERAWYRSAADVSMPLTMRHFLRTGQVEGAAGPHFDAMTYLDDEPDAAGHPGGPLGHFLAHADTDTLTVPARGSQVRPVRLGDLTAQLVRLAAVPDDGATVVDWHRQRAEVGERVDGRVSLLVVAHDDRYLARTAVEAALDTLDGRDVEVVVAATGSRRDVPAILAACFAADARVHVLRLPADTRCDAVAVDVALAASTGDVAAMLTDDVQVHAGWLEPLVVALDRPDVLAAQPLILTADDTIWSAGTVSFGPGLVPGRLLADHPVEDVPDGAPLRPDAVSQVCCVARASVLIGADGLDPGFGDLADVDLWLRLTESLGGHVETVPESRVSRRVRGLPVLPEDDAGRFLAAWDGRLPTVDPTHWERAGLHLVGVTSDRSTQPARPRLAREPSIVPDGPGAGLPRLRWAVKIAAKGGPLGDAWGDTYFADALVRSLRHWGQEAFVDRRGAHQRPGVDDLDDVTLTLRGLWPAVAQPGATNVLWVISHPDDVTVDELDQGFDLVYSAGRAWAASMSTATAEPVRTLLQATDTQRFTPEGETMPGLGTLFVGRTREVLRPVVRDAVEVGADLTIFGDGWADFIDPGHVAADHLPNDEVPAAYRGARIVLNDHWADMARLGFYSNRLFDAVAAGARVVSDPVDGVEDVLGPAVRTYRTTDELRALLDPGSTAWPDAEQIAVNAARVAAEHSFVARARTLLADVLDARGVTHDVNDRPS